jgi:hypothetical protein
MKISFLVHHFPRTTLPEISLHSFGALGRVIGPATDLSTFARARDILLPVPKLPPPRFRLIGLLPLGFFLAQTIHYWRYGGLGNLAWMCNVGSLLLAVGILLEHRELIRAAAIWTIPGLPIWIWYVWLNGSPPLSSTLTHVGGLVVGLIVLRRVRMDRTAWLYAFLWYLFMQAVARTLTSPDLNVNVVHRIQPGWESRFGSFWKFWIVMTVAVGITLWVIGLGLSWIWPMRRAQALAESA